ncbi:hypothetical protein [Phaeobacter inhibens]|uniref:hypothetical protein n=1 Tax=Phaeobacter inhibens TaxID=221822 RepID=UPI0021A83CF2|nr:hypothetical protein [Phaeobacter inhibens]UWS06886.1 hypothetical protein K4K98_11560 [Phaeobacter inhibens]
MVDMGDDGEIADVSEVCHARGYDLDSGFGQGGLAGPLVTKRSKMKISNYLDLQHSLEALPYELVKIVCCRAALRAMTVIKPLLDQYDEQTTGRYALALFHDVSKSIVQCNNATLTELTKHSRTKKFASSNLKMLCENDEAFGYGYNTGQVCIRDVDSTSLNRQNAAQHVSKFLEINSRENRDFLFRHLWHDIEIDIAMVQKLDTPSDLFSARELTPGGGLPGDPRYYPSDLLLALKHAGPAWSFWREWYQGFLDGKPLGWELQRRVAEIDNVIWETGPEAVAVEIERIRAEFSGQPSGEDRFPKHEPKSVSHLFDNRVIASASLQGLATQVTHSIERFHAETGANALPEALEPLTALPALLLAVNSTIQKAPHEGTIPSETEDQLRAEIGRLNAKIVELEGKICGLEADIASLPHAERKGIIQLLTQTALWGGLASGLWILSGDDVDLRKRTENLIERKEQVRSLLMQDGLPQTQVKKSLRPVPRPNRA